MFVETAVAAAPQDILLLMCEDYCCSWTTSLQEGPSSIEHWRRME
jgi:hypothetical protein